MLWISSYLWIQRNDRIGMSWTFCLLLQNPSVYTSTYIWLINHRWVIISPAILFLSHIYYWNSTYACRDFWKANLSVQFYKGEGGVRWEGEVTCGQPVMLVRAASCKVPFSHFLNSFMSDLQAIHALGIICICDWNARALGAILIKIRRSIPAHDNLYAMLFHKRCMHENELPIPHWWACKWWQWQQEFWWYILLAIYAAIFSMEQFGTKQQVWYKVLRRSRTIKHTQILFPCSEYSVIWSNALKLLPLSRLWGGQRRENDDAFFQNWAHSQACFFLHSFCSLNFLFSYL